MANKILIVGGSSGIGLSTARELKKIKDLVYILDVYPPPADIAGQIIGYSQVDILDLKTVSKEIGGLKDNYDHLIITAGGATSEEIYAIKNGIPFWNLGSFEIEKIINLNLIAQINLVNSFVFNQQKNLKSVVLTSSINSSGRYGLPYYSTAKAGLEGFTKAAAEDLGKIGIRINCIVPGSTRTNRTIKEGMNFNAIEQQTILHRVNEAKDIAEAIIFLLSSDAITGQCIIIDSGQMLKSIDRY